jgi:peptidoglycan/LPS O-acetylase OafA/YrhL
LSLFLRSRAIVAQTDTLGVTLAPDNVTKNQNTDVSPASDSVVSPRTVEANKLLGLELIRFLSAFAVLVFHYQHFQFRDGALAPDFQRTRQPFYAALSFLYEQGFHGVQLFWCISGFIFFWKYRETIAGGRLSGRRFFVLRFSRLYPLHLATLLLVSLLLVLYHRTNGGLFVYHYNDLRHFILQLFMASDWGFQKGESFDGPIWSISVEILVYALFYSALVFIGKSWRVNVGVLTIWALLKTLNVHSPILDCAALFYAGGLSAMLYQSISNPRRRAAATVTAWCLVALITSLALVFDLLHRDRFQNLFLLVFTPVLLFCLCGDFKIGVTARRCVEAAGNMTYSSYLLHFPLQLALVIGFTTFGIQIPFYHSGFFCVFMAGTLLASYYVYQYFELPAQRALRRRLG